MTFKDCAKLYIEDHKVGWRNAKHAAQWAGTLETYAYPAFGLLPVQSVDGVETGRPLFRVFGFLHAPHQRTKVGPLLRDAIADTGIHAFGWPRADAIEFMLVNTALSRLNITNEVDRYINWPGQACAYKIGELKIRELRQRSETRLGPRFDLRAFHDVVLGAGSIPLTILEKRVDYWINSQLIVTFD